MIQIGLNSFNQCVADAGLMEIQKNYRNGFCLTNPLMDLLFCRYYTGLLSSSKLAMSIEIN